MPGSYLQLGVMVQPAQRGSSQAWRTRAVSIFQSFFYQGNSFKIVFFPVSARGEITRCPWDFQGTYIYSPVKYRRPSGSLVQLFTAPEHFCDPRLYAGRELSLKTTLQSSVTSRSPEHVQT